MKKRFITCVLMMCLPVHGMHQRAHDEATGREIRKNLCLAFCGPVLCGPIAGILAAWAISGSKYTALLLNITNSK